MTTPLTVFTFFVSAALASASLGAKHSKDFSLRYECDVVPTLAGWTLNAGSTVNAAQSSNSWLSFVTSAPQISAYRNSQWSVGFGQDYTAEIRFRTPRQGQMRLDVDDGGTFRDTVFISSTGLLWNNNGTSTLISANTSNAIHVVRVASWSDQGLRMVQIWQDGSSVYGPALNLTPSSGALFLFGDPSSFEQCDTEIDFLRLIIGGAYEPFVPQLGIGRNPNAVALNWSMSPKSVYQLQAVSPLMTNGWLNLGAPIPAQTASSSLIDSINGKTSGFYRVQEIVEGAINQTFTPGAPPTCANLPAFQCVGASCLNLVPFTPVSGVGYENFPVNGETTNDQYRSFVRLEVRQAIQYAAAKVACQAAHWQFGNNRPIGLGDMSEANGSIPGTRDGNPSHPIGTHTNGRDIDVAYYQLDTTNNNLRAICESRISGVEQYHCVAAPNILDVWRTAFFVGILMDHPRLRVIGVDGRVGPLLIQAIGQLSQAGWLSTNAPTVAQTKLAYETTDGGLGWYYFHHQYMHISFLN